MTALWYGHVLLALASLVEWHRILAVIETGVISPNLQLPNEWLLNHWNITADISIAMFLPPKCGTYTSREQGR